MADPFSIAGTAVGITSLGIQVCQGLAQYYSQFRSYHDDIDAVVARLEALQGILEALRAVKRKVETDNDEASEQLQMALGACENGLNDLEKSAKKCGEIKLPETLQDKARLARKRLLWPFKKDTLMGLQNVLDRVLTNLKLALQILGFEVENQHFEALLTKANTLVLKTENLSDKVEEQTLAIQSLESGVQEISSAQGLQTNVLTSHMSKLSTQFEQLSLQQGNAIQMLNVLVSANSTGQDSLVPSQALVLNTMSESADFRHSFRRSLHDYKSSIAESQSLLRPRAPECLCCTGPRKRERRVTRLFYQIISREISEHLPSCHRFPHADYCRTLEAAFKVYTIGLKCQVRAGFVHARKMGWTSLYPILKFRAIVSEDSPAFKPFSHAPKYLEPRPYIHGEPPQREKTALRHALYRIQHEVIRSFQLKLASPNDTLADGTTVFHYACTFATQLVVCRIIDSNLACDFLDAFIVEGVPINEPNNNGMAPFSTFLRTAPRYRHKEIQRNLISLGHFIIQRSASWSMPWYYFPSDVNFLAALASTEQASLAFEETSAIQGALVRRSEPSLVHVLHVYDKNRATDSRPEPEAWDFAATWPEGLRLLLSSNISWIESTRHTALDSAINMGNPESVMMLMEAGFPISLHTWDRACRNSDYLEPIQKALYAYIAKRMIKNDVDFTGFTGVTEQMHPYHCSNLSPAAADALWNAGFHDIDASTGPWGTALCVHALRDEERFLYRPPILKWFLDKGARLDWVHPKLQTTVAHLIIRRNVTDFDIYDTVEDQDVHIAEREVLLAALAVDIRDRCVCSCSNGGCQTIGCIFRNPWMSFPGGLLGHTIPLGRTVDGIIGKLEYRLTAYSEDAIVVLRVMTFDRLGLTHTCCERELQNATWGSIYYVTENMVFFSEPTNEEIPNIHYIEQEQIKLLQTLMDEFENSWESYEGTFREFVKQVWTPRMDDVCAEILEVDDDEIRRIEELGVALEDPGSSDESGDESDDLGDGRDEMW